MRYLDSIEKTAREHPGLLALRVSTGECLTYGELWSASDALARAVAARVEPGAPVIVYGNKDPLMLIGFLACMKAGCPYVPVDCSSVPDERLSCIAGQISSGRPVPLVLATVEFPRVDGMPRLEVIVRSELERVIGAVSDSLDERAPGSHAGGDRWISGEDVAYILFTSGSTGAPKGVEVTAACFDNFCSWDIELARPVASARHVDGGSGCAGAAGGGVWLDQAPFSFDLSVFELAGALAMGGSLFSLASETQKSMAAQMEALSSSGTSVWVSTPSYAEMCMANVEFRQGLLPDLRLFIFCGETLPNSLAARLLERFPDARVLNTYGPTESTVAVTSVEVTTGMAESEAPLPVGAPRPGTRIRIIDGEGMDCPAGQFGEVVIEGDTVALGYYRRPDLTARAFGGAELGGSKVRSYRTGDEGCLDESGCLHFRGRLDLQVKLNGYRIELGEIEEHLRRLPEIAAAAVVAETRDGKVSHLVAHVVPAGSLPQAPFRAGLALKDRLKRALPHYMVPKKVVFREALPMTGNGKVDRRALASSDR